MPRPVTKPNGKRLSVYVSEDIYNKIMSLKSPKESLSSFVESSIIFYAEHSDIIEEFKKLREKYIALKNQSHISSPTSFIVELKKHLVEKKSWYDIMKDMGVTEPREIVSKLNKYTNYIKDNKNERYISGIDNWILVDLGHAKSDVFFVAHRIS